MTTTKTTVLPEPAIIKVTVKQQQKTATITPSKMTTVAKTTIKTSLKQKITTTTPTTAAAVATAATKQQ